MFYPPPHFPPRLPRTGKLDMLIAVGALGYGVWQYWKNRKRSNSVVRTDNTGNVFFPSNEEPFPLGSLNNKQIALKSVSVDGILEGLLFTSIIKQEYKNETSKALEIIYTFPVGWNTTLLGLEAVIGEKRLTGQVVENGEAEETYEKAVSDGDSAIMVQQSSMGLYTANLGNIKPGESVTMEIRCAKLLNLEQNGLRLTVPTAIGERYGNPHCEGGLSPHEAVKTDGSAKYGFSLEITVKGDLAQRAIECPTHKVSMDKKGDGVIIRLDPDAVMDRDFVLLVSGCEAASQALCVPDGEACLVAASFLPEFPKQTISPIGLKILVDCSGSMSGESIDQARRGLGRILAELRPEDYMSYSRFGSSVVHLDTTMRPCAPDTLNEFSRAIDATEADLGGTEMAGAINAVIKKVQCPDREEIPPAILIITDGDAWDVNNIIASVKNSGHRVFAVGVGRAPAESLLRKLAEQTGGACEFVTPEEDMAAVIVKMFHRIRGSIATSIKVKWPEAPLWQSRPPRFIYDGETVRAFAWFSTKPERGPALTWRADGKEFSAEAAVLEKTDNADLVRLAWKLRMDETDSRKEQLAIALKYQLVSAQTSLILVNEREEADKTRELPQIQHVPQMPVYGHGCNPAVKNYGVTFASFADLGFHKFFDMGPAFCASDEVPQFLHMNDDADAKQKKSVPAELLDTLWREYIYEIQTLGKFTRALARMPEFAAVAQAVAEIAQMLNESEEAVWARLIMMTQDFIKKNGGKAPERHAKRLLDAVLKDVKPAMFELVDNALDERVELV